jgi:drug/metabolite transporter (DMT)-like permease
MARPKKSFKNILATGSKGFILQIIYNKAHLGLLLTLAAAAVFGLWPSCIRAAYAGGANVSFAILITTAARAGALWLFCLFTHKPLFAKKEDTKLAISGGVFQIAGAGLAIAAMAYLPGPVAMTLMFTHTIMLLLFLAWKGEAKLDGLTAGSTLAALFGLTFVLDLWHASGESSLPGIACALASAVATMSRLYVFGHRTKTHNPAVVGAETFLVSLALAFVFALVKWPVPPASLPGWGWALLGSLSLALGTFGMFYAIALIGSFRFSLILKTEPVFTSLFAVLLIGETLKWTQYAGILVVVGSLGAYQYMTRERPIKSTP